jgi:two-component system cell cycle response regulator DivK
VSSAPLILYIEDNNDNRKLVSRVLKAAGFTVHGVANAPAGFDFIRSQTPDLILVDIHLPDMDGYTMTARLREFKELTHTPIIALTANILKEDKEKCIAAGCSGFIQKPINVDRLPDQIRAYLANR